MVGVRFIFILKLKLKENYVHWNHEMKNTCIKGEWAYERQDSHSVVPGFFRHSTGQ